MIKENILQKLLKNFRPPKKRRYSTRKYKNISKEELSIKIRAHNKVLYPDQDLGDLSETMKLGCVNLSGETLTIISLATAELSSCNLSNTKLTQTHLMEANLYCADFYNADMQQAKLNNCCAQKADFVSANLIHADFTNANVDDADFSGANLEGVIFDNVNLRTAKNIVFSDNSIVGTRFSPHANDPYSILRRGYTGARTAVILLLTLIAIAPYAMQAISWSFIGKMEERINLGNFSRTTDAQREPQEINNLIISTLSANSNEINTVSKKSKMNEVYTISIISGWTDANNIFMKISAVLLTFLVFFYNGIRIWVTLNIAELRDIEERSQHIPHKEDYWKYYLWHKRFLNMTFYIIFIYSVIKICGLLFQEVWIPSVI